jgi:cold shock CspA family protein
MHPNSNSTRMIQQEGIVKTIRSEKGFGFIHSNRNEYYFKLYQLKNNIKEHDTVRFNIGRRNGKPVATYIRKVFTNSHDIRFISRIDSHLHEGVENYLPCALNRIKAVASDFTTEQIDFEKPIGMCNCIPTGPDDQTYFAIRCNRRGHSRFVLNQQTIRTNSITLVLKRCEDHYLIITGYLGTKSCVEPFDEKATTTDMDFWSTHAFVHGTERTIEGSETFINPWQLAQPSICKVPSTGSKLNPIQPIMF